MSASGERNRIGIVSITLAMGCFGVNDALSKLASQTVPAFELIFLRSAFVALILSIVFMFRGFADHARHLVKPVVIGRGLLDAVGSVCFLIGLFNVPIATATTISMSAPLMLTLAAVASGEVVPIVRWLCTAIGFVGVLLVVQPHRDGVDVYAGLCVVGTIVNLMRDLMTRGIDRDVPSISLSAGSAIAILILTGVLTFAQGWRMPTAAGLGLIAAASVFITGGYVLIVHGMQNGDLAVIAPFRYVSLPLAVALGYLIWGEVPSWMGGVGMGLILMAALQVSKRR